MKSTAPNRKRSVVDHVRAFELATLPVLVCPVTGVGLNTVFKCSEQSTVPLMIVDPPFHGLSLRRRARPTHPFVVSCLFWCWCCWLGVCPSSSQAGHTFAGPVCCLRLCGCVLLGACLCEDTATPSSHTRTSADKDWHSHAATHRRPHCRAAFFTVGCSCCMNSPTGQVADVHGVRLVPGVLGCRAPVGCGRGRQWGTQG
jgi:hypothetical protein